MTANSGQASSVETSPTETFGGPNEELAAKIRFEVVQYELRQSLDNRDQWVAEGWCAAQEASKGKQRDVELVFEV